ncbi:class I SAM-dependent methyltransferase [Streptomyces sp. NPDC051684]|uniref:class I SAM-dependent methyltransferase n=1 Tax=Streptomyces sp. NPDC051684 TaxID=3365670 RepID=UPI0037A2299C
MLDYDEEANRYDATRGGEPRARAAADAVLALVPENAHTLLDLACGTGIVTRHLTREGLRPFGVDRAAAMLRGAAPRLSGAVCQADVRRLPFADDTFDAVSAVWLLHLLPDAAPVVAEAARVLRPGGVFVTTVDKAAAHLGGSDICALVAPHGRRRLADATARITQLAAEHGLHPHGSAGFTGHGQGRVPAKLAREVRAGRIYPKGGEDLAAHLEALPNQQTARPDPVYTVLAFSA